MFCVYIIFSDSLNRYYIGHTADLQNRLQQHNSGISKFTSAASDWILKYSKNFATRKEAHQEEINIKKKKSRKYLEFLIANQ